MIGINKRFRRFQAPISLCCVQFARLISSPEVLSPDSGWLNVERNSGPSFVLPTDIPMASKAYTSAKGKMLLRRSPLWESKRDHRLVALSTSTGWPNTEVIK